MYFEKFEKQALEYIKTEGLDAENLAIGRKYAEVKAVDDGVTDVKIGDTIRLSGYLSTFGGVDRSNDTVMKGAFTKSLKNQAKYPLLINHEAKTDTQVGSFTAVEDDYGLKWDASFLVTEKTLHEARLIKAGHLTTASMGGIFKYGERSKAGEPNRIDEVILFEGSIVPVPCNQDAVFTALKSLSVENEPVNQSAENAQVSNSDKVLEVKNILKKRGF